MAFTFTFTYSIHITKKVTSNGFQTAHTHTHTHTHKHNTSAEIIGETKQALETELATGQETSTVKQSVLNSNRACIAYVG